MKLISKIIGFAAAGILVAALGGCGSAANHTDTAAEEASSSSVRDAGSTAAESTSNSTGRSDGIVIPDQIETIPDDYFKESDQPGTLEEVTYNTWESFSYDKKTTQLTKHAIVYLPNGYDKNQKYDIFYLMHDGWSDYTTTFGTPDQPTEFKNVIDNTMEQGDIRPMIIVCPTYNNTNENGLDSNDFSLAL